MKRSAQKERKEPQLREGFTLHNEKVLEMVAENVNFPIQNPKWNQNAVEGGDNKINLKELRMKDTVSAKVTEYNKSF